MGDFDDKTIGIIIGGTVLGILLLSAFFIMGDGINFVDALVLLLLYFIIPAILLGISYFAPAILFDFIKVKDPGPLPHLLAFFVFCFLLLAYGAFLGYYPIGLIIDNLPIFIVVAIIASIGTYVILAIKKFIYGGWRYK